VFQVTARAEMSAVAASGPRRSDADRRFRFEGLPMGDYVVNSTVTWQVPRYGLQVGVVASRAHIENGKTAEVVLRARPMRNHGVCGDAVYEPFSGSRTSIVAADTTGRPTATSPSPYGRRWRSSVASVLKVTCADDIGSGGSRRSSSKRTGL
jgi:hypothetical protein